MNPFKTSVIKRAAWIGAGWVLAGFILGVPGWSLGAVIGTLTAFLNFEFMIRSVVRSLAFQKVRAKSTFLLNSLIRICLLAVLLSFLLKWDLAAGIGFCAGLSTIMAGLVSSLFIPFKTVPGEGAQR